VERIVKKYAEILPCFEEILQGDFLLFDNIVKTRKNNPKYNQIPTEK